MLRMECMHLFVNNRQLAAWIITEGEFDLHQVTCAGDIFLFHSLFNCQANQSQACLICSRIFDMRGIIKYDMALTLFFKMNTKMDECCFYDDLIYYRINEFDSERRKKCFQSTMS